MSITPGVAAPTGGRPARVVLVGAGGFGRVHRQRIADAASRGEAELVAVVDPFCAELLGPDAAVLLTTTLPAALEAVGGADVVSIAAPIAEHAELAATALQAGADVLLEKPPVALWSDFQRLLELEVSTGRRIQVGFQSLATDGPAAFETDRLGLGAVTQIGAVGLWKRSLHYWSRSAWAGRRQLGGRPVLDGVVTNPLAHAVATACAVAGCRRAEDVLEVEVELLRANEIEADDTSVVRVRTAAGPVVTCALTLCAPDDHEPVIQVQAEHGRADYAYSADRIEVTVDDQTSRVDVSRTDLLANLLAARRGGAALLVPLVATGAFMRVVDAVAATEPRPLDPRWVSWPGEGPDRHAVLHDVEHWVRRAAEQGRTFTELGAPWADTGSSRA